MWEAVWGWKWVSVTAWEWGVGWEQGSERKLGLPWVEVLDEPMVTVLEQA